MPEDRQLTAPATLLDIMRDRAERYRDKVAFDYSTGAEEHSLLSDGVDAITEIPLDRWGADASGNANTRWGGFLDQVDQVRPIRPGGRPRLPAQSEAVGAPIKSR
jgi:hypothetical protein